ncbi:phosphatidate cytidylyltransferase [Peptoniphilus catoniae]|uniref:phosphatidate cytidylyltransferase n=1 Tax=Peptoniphilus catoniae TaxID=1660341 RepID=UPI0010FD1E2D|nr:phosphatidate cytidylyltransferase [Peptoniphilus catoniae]
MSDFTKRFTTGAIGIIFLGILIYLGGLYLKFSLAIVSAFASYELANAFRKIRIRVNLDAIVLGIVLLLIFDKIVIPEYFAIIAVLVVSFIMFLFGNYSTSDLTHTVFIFIYVPFIFNLFSQLPRKFFIMVFLIAFITDTFAYLIGSTFGKHKLIEKVSPKKSIEGAVGGVLGCLIITLIYSYYVGLNINLELLFLIVASSIMAQLGDLFASKIKRITGIKDYSNLLPGHGGLMDRFDSVIMVIPMVYLIYYFYVL